MFWKICHHTHLHGALEQFVARVKARGQIRHAGHDNKIFGNPAYLSLVTDQIDTLYVMYI